MNRRCFLQILGIAPAIAVTKKYFFLDGLWRPSLADMVWILDHERPMGGHYVPVARYTSEALEALKNGLPFNRHTFSLNWPRIGDTIRVRTPARFQAKVSSLNCS